MVRPLPVILSGLDPGTRAALCLLSLIAGYLNYEGLVATAPDALAASFAWKCAALIAATGVFVALMIFWAYALAIIPGLVDRPRHMVGGLGLVASFAPLIFFMSAAWNAAYLAKPESERLNLEAAATDAGRAVSALAARIALAGELLVDLRALHAYLDDLARREAQEGILSGDPRCAAVCNGLKAQASSLAALLAAAETAQRAGEAKASAASASLAKMRALTRTQAGDASPLAQAASLVADINARIAEAGAGGLAGTIGRTAGALPGSLIVPGNANPRQRAALDTLRAALTERARPIEARASTLAALPPVAAISFTPDNALRAAFRHYDALLAQWAIGLSVDILPLFLLLYRIIAADAIRRDARDPVHGAARLWTADQLIEGRTILDLVAARGAHGAPHAAKPQPTLPKATAAPPVAVGAMTPPSPKKRGRPPKVTVNGAAAP